MTPITNKQIRDTPSAIVLKSAEGSELFINRCCPYRQEQQYCGEACALFSIQMRLQGSKTDNKIMSCDFVAHLGCHGIEIPLQFDTAEH